MEIKDIIKTTETIPETTSFKDAVTLMIEKQTNSLLVTDAAGKLAGEVSVSDLMDAIVPEHLNDDTIAAHFATSDMFKSAITDTR